MKYRIGFVSNSSTTSFCIYGMSSEDVDSFKNDFIDIILNKYSITEIQEIFNTTDIIDQQTLTSYIKDDINESICQLLGKESPDIPWLVYDVLDWDQIFIGCSLSLLFTNKLFKNKTIDEIKKEIEFGISSIFKNKYKCSIHKEAYRH